MDDVVHDAVPSPLTTRLNLWCQTHFVTTIHSGSKYWAFQIDTGFSEVWYRCRFWGFSLTDVDMCCPLRQNWNRTAYAPQKTNDDISGWFLLMFCVWSFLSIKCDNTDTTSDNTLVHTEMCEPKKTKKQKKGYNRLEHVIKWLQFQFLIKVCPFVEHMVYATANKH